MTKFPFLACTFLVARALPALAQQPLTQPPLAQQPVPALAPGAAVATIPTVPGQKLVWNDEFDKDGVPDPSKWNYEQGFVRNQEPQWYQPQNAWVENGFLIIEARRERVAVPSYQAGSTNWKTNRKFAEFTSSSLTTKGKTGWTYGHFEMRARIDTRPGSWPAFWTVGTSRDWPFSGEIDIMEYYNSGLLANLAWGGKTPGSAVWNSRTKPLKTFDADWPNQFHVWAMDWDQNQMVLSCDGQALNTQDVTKTRNGDAEAFNPFQAPQFIILNQAIGHGDPAKTQFPLRFEVDYVRVYQPETP